MIDFKKYDIYIFDYEGTLSEPPDHKLTLQELLYDFDFRKLFPNNAIHDFFNLINKKKVYVVGIIETDREIEQKKEWLKYYYPSINVENCIFISGEHKKSEAILEIINKNNYEKDKILFIDDKISHIKDVNELGINSILTKDIK